MTDTTIAFNPLDPLGILAAITSALNSMNSAQSAGAPTLSLPPLLSNGTLATFPFGISKTMQQSAGGVPSGIPLLPPLSDLPEFLASSQSQMAAGPETAITTIINAITGGLNSQQQGAAQAGQQVSQAIRTAVSQIILAPETVREQLVGQVTPPIVAGGSSGSSEQQSGSDLTLFQ